ncbi:hypothetical protein AAMO2058_000425100 [Amorphochlora amoebiformis]
MGGHPFVYRRSEWNEARLVVAILHTFCDVVFTCLHTRHYIHVLSTYNRTDRGRDLRTSILVCNWFALLTVPVCVWVNVAINVNQNSYTCRWVYSLEMFTYFVYNWLMYRVLLAKSRTYDAMDDHPKLHFWISLAVNTFCPGFWVCAAILIGLADFSIKQNQGEMVCYMDVTYFETFIPVTLLAVADSAISIGCLYLMLLPILEGTLLSHAELGVVRNCVWASIAILSTFVFLSVNAVVDALDGWIVGFNIDLGLWDGVVNIIAVNMCWPLRFYKRSIYRLFGIPLPPPRSKVTTDCVKAPGRTSKATSPVSRISRFSEVQNKIRGDTPPTSKNTSRYRINSGVEHGVSSPHSGVNSKIVHEHGPVSLSFSGNYAENIAISQNVDTKNAQGVRNKVLTRAELEKKLTYPLGRASSDEDSPVNPSPATRPRTNGHISAVNLANTSINTSRTPSSGMGNMSSSPGSNSVSVVSRSSRAPNWSGRA